MVANHVPWRTLLEDFKADPLYGNEAFAQRCIDELGSGAAITFVCQDDISGPQAELLHLICEQGGLARVDTGEGKRDSAEGLDRAYSDFAYFVDGLTVPRLMLRDFLRSKRLPLPAGTFPGEHDNTEMVVRAYREESRTAPLYLDGAREIIKQAAPPDAPPADPASPKPESQDEAEVVKVQRMSLQGKTPWEVAKTLASLPPEVVAAVLHKHMPNKTSLTEIGRILLGGSLDVKTYRKKAKELLAKAPRVEVI